MSDTYALVTGASSGIGYEYARQIAARGYNLVIVSNEIDALEEKSTILRNEFKVDVISLCMDLSRQESAKELYEICKERGYCIEVLINNAGVYHDKTFLDDSEGFTNLILNLHVYTPAMLCYYFGHDMVSRGKGYILNMSSVTSNIAVQRLSTYSSTKAFLKNFSRSLHIELYSKGVYVTCVRPGAIATTLYNLKPSAVKTGLMIGYIMTPEKLVKKALNALMRGKHRITPGFFTKLLMVLIALVPVSVLKFIQKRNIF